MRALVLGGYGAVGAETVAELRSAGDTAFAAGRDPSRADRVVDLTSRSSYQSALGDIDVVINAAGLEDPQLADLATEAGATFVEVSATTKYIAALGLLKPAAAVLVNVGLAPGLSNLLAADVRATSPGPVDIAVLLGAGEKHGAAAIDWTYRLLGRHFPDTQHTGRTVRNYTQPSRFQLPGYGRRSLFRTDFSDQHTLTRDLGVPVRTYLGMDSRLVTASLAALTWVPGGSRLPRGIQLPGSTRWLILARAPDGATRWAHGLGQSHATAVMAVTAAHAATALPAGVHHLHQVLTLAGVPTAKGLNVEPANPDR